MKFDPQKHHRRSIRLPGYDYSKCGAYYVTICTQQRLCLFGEIAAGTMALNEAGRMIETVLKTHPARFVNVEIIDYIIMPNHIHIVVQIESETSVGVPLVGTLVQDEMDLRPEHHDAVDIVPIEPKTSGVPLVGTLVQDEMDLRPEHHDVADVAPTESKIDDNEIHDVPDDDNETHNVPDDDDKRVPTRGTPTTLGDFVGSFKSITTNEYIRGVKQDGWESFPGRLWQSNYYERIVRNEDELNRIREYIDENPQNWETDEENPNRIGNSRQKSTAVAEPRR